MNFLDLPHGLHDGYPNEEYHRKLLGVASTSALNYVLRSAATYFAWINGENVDGRSSEESAALAFGSAFHMAILEPDLFARTYVVAPDFGHTRAHKPSGTTKEQGAANKAREAEWEAENAGKLQLSAADARAIQGMRDSLAKDPDAGPHFRGLWEGRDGYRAEVTAKWECRESGIVCRARPDLLEPEDVAWDLKSCTDASTDGFNHSRARWKYHRQDAHYRDGCDSCGNPVRRFRFIAVEKTPPYLTKAHECSPDALALGREDALRGKLDLMRCIALDDWPGLPDGPSVLELYPWERKSRP